MNGGHCNVSELFRWPVRAGWRQRALFKRLPVLGTDIDKVTQQLENEGVVEFKKPFDEFMAAVAQRSPRPDTRES
jgi:hypothetical protein